MNLYPNRTYRRKDDHSIIRVRGSYESGYLIEHLSDKLKHLENDIMLRKEAKNYEEFKPIIKIDLNVNDEVFNIVHEMLCSQDINPNMNGMDAGLISSYKEQLKEIWDADIGSDTKYESIHDAFQDIILDDRTLSEQDKENVEYNEAFSWALCSLGIMKKIFAKSPLTKVKEDVGEEHESSERADDQD
jgi:hypothetical protein